ncbi:exosortase-associated EpsI family protein [Fuerstiella marisgermanici]|uniref:Methanolan biosynthesis EpsI domain-containing protein n=1 Tax=Fuerstiella marisgermanici TaxID=1891926 RepID=A0A1P8WKP6_9PLAN|nr:exosortase-associated EpsI family protein [Fuerstiella marisgermanici]APZ94636.1 hypothetical protein Fuma_04269 [Fuerstiella marisgermanici]
MQKTKIKRRDLLLMGAGTAALVVGKFADSSINGFDTADKSDLNNAVARLHDIPTDIGNWSSSSDAELTEREQEVAGISGYVRRHYTNPRIGYSVHLTVLCGASGPISVHPPTACFEGIGYTLASGPTPTLIKSDDGNSANEFNKSSFRQGDASVPEIVRVFWGWGTDGAWKAPSNPRFEFRGKSYLYKIYVTDSRIDTGEDSALPQIETFLKDALPAITTALSGQDSVPQ